MARRVTGKLKATQIQSFKDAGRYSDGNGLYLKIRPGGTRSWVFLFEKTVGDRRVQRELGLGKAGEKDGVSLAEAREKAMAYRKILANGGDPAAEKQQSDLEAKRAVVTFGKFADDFLAEQMKKGVWRSDKHAAGWRLCLSDAYCKTIRNMPIGEITKEHVAAT